MRCTRVRLMLALFVFVLSPFGQFAGAATRTPAADPTAEPIQIQSSDLSGYRVVAEYPHDTNAYTQGLVIHGGALYEGTGQYGESDLRLVDLETGEVIRSADLSEEYFGEGIVVVEDRINQLTWQEETAFVYDRETFDVVETFSYSTQGWGLTYDGEYLVMSDGSNQITYRDPETFEVVKTIDVMYRGAPVQLLNELEYINGEIWANIYFSEFIARIDPATGEVISWVDMRGLLTDEEMSLLAPGDVLNGIAYDPDTDQIYVTGKMWPRLFEIELVPWVQ